MKLVKDYLNLKKCIYQIHKFDVYILPIIFFESALEAMIPYVPIVLISYLVDRLGEQYPISKLLLATMFAVILLFLMNLARGKLYYGFWPGTENCNDKMDGLYGEKTLTMDFQQLDSEKVNNLRAKIQNDRNWGGGIYGMIPQLQGCLSGFFGFLIAVVLIIPIFINGRLYQGFGVFIFLCYALILTFFSTWFQKSTAERELMVREKFDFGSGRSNYLQRGGITYREGKDIRIYGAKPLIKSALKEEKKDKMVLEVSKLEAIAGAVDGTISALLLGGAYMFVVIQAINGRVGIGSVVLFASAIFRFSESIKSLAKSFSEIMVNAERMQSSFSYLELPEVLEKGKFKVPNDIDNLVIELKDVSFHYPSDEHEVLSHIYLKLHHGNQIAIVGKNGSGKSTLIKLLCRLYEPTSGAIFLNGVDIREYDYNEYLTLFSVVFQDFKLLPLSLGSNLSGNVSYDVDRAKDCLEKAGFGERLKKMNYRYDTPLYREMEEIGVELSGGEAQKVALARALYKNAPFVVLDEPTAALDPISEYEIYAGFRNMVGNKTALFISHRLSSCRFCKEIVVLDQGKITQRGSHEELVWDKNGIYYRLWEAQAQYYQEEAI
ncbi:ATP-binding cassette, subfamily B [Anaerocolumna jejuensis DSM 15929]|uniref:ATP-binding cassette, subfamily B n=1 Tax=Anaerocolumna jejuensis DSM 15929 TaxID=1121322 RepID=A0A1M7DLS1_9FIRM|nr:ABC transporter ATP-binding protein [Anaerocolumna jejuensis]SHL80422.1 ATP-binding cassette, subfamily B [Anaerocolumna jejuensis DSM 15929]